MNVDPVTFRQTIGLFTSGVGVIAVGADDAVHAMTASAITSVSLDPMLVLFCVGRSAKMAARLQAAEGFTINVLRHDQQALSNFFAGRRGGPVPPFRFVPWVGGPRLEGCAASIGCTTDRLVEAGDHWLVLGAVRGLHRGVEPIEPLVFFHGRYAELRPEAGDLAPEPVNESASVQVFYEP